MSQIDKVIRHNKVQHDSLLSTTSSLAIRDSKRVSTLNEIDNYIDQLESDLNSILENDIDNMDDMDEYSSTSTAIDDLSESSGETLATTTFNKVTLSRHKRPTTKPKSKLSTSIIDINSKGNLNVVDRGLIVENQGSYLIETTKLKPKPTRDLPISPIEIVDDDVNSPDTPKDKIIHESMNTPHNNSNDTNDHIKEHSKSQHDSLVSNQQYIDNSQDLNELNDMGELQPQNLYHDNYLSYIESDSTTTLQSSSKTKGMLDKYKNSKLFKILPILCILISLTLSTLIPILVYKESCFNNLKECRLEFLQQCKSECNPIDVKEHGCICENTCQCTTEECKSKFVKINDMTNINLRLLDNALNATQLNCKDQNQLMNNLSDKQANTLAYFMSIFPDENQIKVFSDSLKSNKPYNYGSLIYDNNFIFNSTATRMTTFGIDAQLMKIQTLSQLKSKPLEQLFTKYGKSSTDLIQFRSTIAQSDVLLSQLPQNANNILKINCDQTSFEIAHFGKEIPSDCRFKPVIGYLNIKRITSADVSGKLLQVGGILKTENILIAPFNTTTGNHSEEIGTVDALDHVLYDYLMDLERKDAVNFIDFILGDGSLNKDNPPFLYAYAYNATSLDLFTMSITADNTNNTKLILKDMIPFRQSIRRANKTLLLNYNSDFIVDSSLLNSIWISVNGTGDSTWAAIKQRMI